MTETGAPGPRMNDPPPPRPESPIQLIQGCYYVIAGLGVAIGLSTLQSVTGPPVDLPNQWLVRVVGALVACVGVGLIIASRRSERIRVAIGGPMVLAVFLALLNVVGIANGALPMTFLLDIGMEIGFFAWWAFELYASAAPEETAVVRAHGPSANLHP
jgi:hypothetical protein